MENCGSLQYDLVLPSTPNKIFQLNEDCLVEVFRYLPVKDVVAMIQTDERFRPAALIRFRYSGGEQINKDFLNLPPDILEDFYRTYGPRASKLEIAFLTDSDFSNAIRRFQNLIELSLREVSVSGDIADNIELPKSLKVLRIFHCQIPQALLVQVNPTLHTLHIWEGRWGLELEAYQYHRLRALTNITKLSVHGADKVGSVGELIEQNKNHLRSFTLRPSFDAPLPADIAKVIWRLHQLTELKLLNYKPVQFGRVEPWPFNLWPKLSYHL